ncbi:hypothetical protein NLX86_26030 [Streptomyces sp. A3M-1-3]|uniref:hypothetical protein n=1 Tax=Streptomyces sp. A3M-1-3 TaxID=2962044 RepID=UPI0020B8D147|nr:hypothetical protein [Streptomyces sp. A3M-1-3]MCP3821430.1 hypothetical protein [Streptomyces sp. A3M-1-3]
MYWLVPVGTAASWDVPHTEALGPSTYVVVPPAILLSGPGDHWERPPGPDGYLTDPGALRGALHKAVADALGPRPKVSA